MFAGYVRTESVAVAASQTLDPEKPCEICRAVSRAREAAGSHGAAVQNPSSERIVLILERAGRLVVRSEERQWPRVGQASAESPRSDVPVPPPRLAA